MLRLTPQLWHMMQLARTNKAHLRQNSMFEFDAAANDTEEHEEVPEDLVHLLPEQQQTQIKIRSAGMLLFGTALVLIFSDPMVEVLSEVGVRLGISAFYVSFVLAPLASNASELLASVKYASKKTSKTITISLSALQGACCLNNTLGLGVFLFLIYFRKLAWEFSAETTTVLAVEIVMAFMSFRSTHRILDAIAVIMLYPLSLLLVATLESWGWD
jgi:Ca2+/Na+ antiporter